jgi:sugar lactone lactonase YvrE
MLDTSPRKSAPRRLGWVPLLLFVCGPGPALAADSDAAAHTTVHVTSQVVQGWPQSPADLPFGRALGVAVDSKGLVYVSHTADRDAGNATPIARPTIFVFAADTGQFVRALGAGLFRYPHGLAIDDEDFLWVTDSEANRVYRLDPQGRVTLELGGE